MFSDFTIDEQSELSSALMHLEILKMLQEDGYEFSDVRLWSYGDEYYSKENFGGFILRLICGTENFEIDEATDESGAIKGYELYVEPDEFTFFEILIKQPDIMEYINWYKEKGCEFEKLPEGFKSATYALTETTCQHWSYDYEGYESWPAKDFSGVVLLISDFNFIDFNFVTALLGLISFCKNENLKRKENENYDNGICIAA